MFDVVIQLGAIMAVVLIFWKKLFPFGKKNNAHPLNKDGFGASFDNENWATMYVTSSGSDNPRPVKLRKKPSTGQWFLNEIQCLSDIRVPTADDPWA